jgi:hypothetical protein
VLLWQGELQVHPKLMSGLEHSTGAVSLGTWSISIPELMQCVPGSPIWQTSKLTWRPF